MFPYPLLYYYSLSAYLHSGFIVDSTKQGKASRLAVKSCAYRFISRLASGWKCALRFIKTRKVAQTSWYHITLGQLRAKFSNFRSAQLRQLPSKYFRSELIVKVETEIVHEYYVRSSHYQQTFSSRDGQIFMFSFCKLNLQDYFCCKRCKIVKLET